MYGIMWQFDIGPGSEASFEAACGARGGWDRLFRTAPGHLAPTLLRDSSANARCLTLILTAGVGGVRTRIA
jgi:hypothetical protein